LKIAVFNTKYIKYLAFYLLSYFGIAIMVDFKFVFIHRSLHSSAKWLCGIKTAFKIGGARFE